MKVRLKFVQWKSLESGDYFAVFLTQFGEELGAYVSRSRYTDYFSYFKLDEIYNLNVRPYRSKSGSLGLSVELPRLSSDEILF